MATVELLPLIAKTLQTDAAELTAESGMKNTPKWDSLRHLLVMTEIERVSGKKLSYKEMTEATSVGQIHALLTSHGVDATL